jgi:hypothetical protein
MHAEDSAHTFGMRRQIKVDLDKIGLHARTIMLQPAGEEKTKSRLKTRNITAANRKKS